MEDEARGSAPIPPLSLLLGFGPALLLPLLGAAAFAVPSRRAWMAVAAGQIWGAAILLFLAGVRRGLSFFTAGGARPIQLATMAGLFLLGLAGLLLPPLPGLLALVAGYGSVAVLDPSAARRGEVPAHFARLRPPQMLVAIGGLLVLVLRTAEG